MKGLEKSISAVDRILHHYADREVNAVISAEDDMIDPRNPSEAEHYMAVGSDALSLILRSMALCQKDTLGAILDMPSGFGRVTRHLVAAFENAELVVCDIEQRKIEFCAATFGATPVLSDDDLANLNFGSCFDLIWSGSLLTHLPRPQFHAALNLFSRSLAPGGICLVTFHGRNTPFVQRTEWKYLADTAFAAAEAQYLETGFGYVSYDAYDSYGITITSPSFVVGCLERDLSISLRAYLERGWDDHQDVAIFEKRHINSR